MVVHTHYYVIGLAVVIVIYGVRRARRSRQLRRLAAQHGCKKIVTASNKLPFAIDRKYQILTHKGPGNVLDDLMTTRFEELGAYTYRDDAWDNPPILCAEPENIKTVLATNFKDWGMEENRFLALGPWLGRGIFMSSHEGQHDLWGVARGLLRPSFQRDDVYDLSIVEEHVQDFVTVLGRKEDGWTTAEDLLPIIRRFTLDMVSTFFCGGCIDAQKKAFPGLKSVDPQNTEDLEKAFDNVNAAAAKRLILGKLCWLMDSKAFRHACTIFSKFGYDRVDKSVKAEKETPYNRFIKEMASRGGDREMMSDLVKQMLFAGIDTSTSLLSLAILHIARTPGAWDRIRAELDHEGIGTGCDPRDVTTTKLRNCKFLQHCITETLRLYPAIPANTRQAFRDTVLPLGGGRDGKSPILVEKGTVIRYSVYVMQRRADLYGPDALEWNPDRWNERRQGWDYIPFNGGPRICVGQKFALAEAAYLLARLAQLHDKIEVTRWEEKISTRIDTALFPKKGVPVRFHREQFA